MNGIIGDQLSIIWRSTSLVFCQVHCFTIITIKPSSSIEVSNNCLNHKKWMQYFTQEITKSSAMEANTSLHKFALWQNQSLNYLIFLYILLIYTLTSVLQANSHTAVVVVVKHWVILTLGKICSAGQRQYIASCHLLPPWWLLLVRNRIMHKNRIMHVQQNLNSDSALYRITFVLIPLQQNQTRTTALKVPLNRIFSRINRTNHFQ